MNDYKTEFHAAVTDLIAQNITDRPERMAAVHALTDAYFDSVGSFPDAAELERLSDYILREELTDTDRMKTRNTEYPFLSEHQFARRQGGEASDAAAEDYGVDGRNYSAPSRRKRSKGEGMLVDQYAKIRNKARAAQYKRDTAPGPEITYNLRETGGELTEEFTQRRGIGARWLADMSAVNEITVEPAEEDAERYVREAA